MKSIRLSMTVYFLGLLALALGAAAWFVYETAYFSLQDKQRMTAHLIETQYQERCRDEEKRRDDQLLQEAQTFNRLIQLEKITRGRDLNLLNVAGLVLSEGTGNPAEALLWGANIGGGQRGDR